MTILIAAHETRPSLHRSFDNMCRVQFVCFSWSSEHKAASDSLHFRIFYQQPASTASKPAASQHRQHSTASQPASQPAHVAFMLMAHADVARVMDFLAKVPLRNACAPLLPQPTIHQYHVFAIKIKSGLSVVCGLKGCAVTCYVVFSCRITPRQQILGVLPHSSLSSCSRTWAFHLLWRLAVEYY
jgi:hypothetical protein